MELDVMKKAEHDKNKNNTLESLIVIDHLNEVLITDLMLFYYIHNLKAIRI